MMVEIDSSMSLPRFESTKMRYHLVGGDGRLLELLPLILNQYRDTPHSPFAWKDDASPVRPHPPTRGLDGAEQCVVTARRSKLM